MTLKIQIMSDLHVEFVGTSGFPPIAIDVEVVVIAGDTCEGLQTAVRRMRAAYPTTAIITVAGNHEFYGRDIREELRQAREVARELGVHLLENDALILGRLRIIGMTLWTDYELFGIASMPHAMQIARETLRDHRRISWQRKPWRRFRPYEARNLHLGSREYLETELAKSHDGPTMIVTHHAPTGSAIAAELRNNTIAAAYASDLHPVIDRYQPDIWIWGHTHRARNAVRGCTRLISNPCGYPDEETGFDPSFTIEVEA